MSSFARARGDVTTALNKKLPRDSNEPRATTPGVATYKPYMTGRQSSFCPHGPPTPRASSWLHYKGSGSILYMLGCVCACVASHTSAAFVLVVLVCVCVCCFCFLMCIQLCVYVLRFHCVRTIAVVQHILYDEFRGIFRPIERVSKRYGMFVYIYIYFKECGNLDIVHRMLETKRAKV